MIIFSAVYKPFHMMRARPGKGCDKREFIGSGAWEGKQRRRLSREDSYMFGTNKTTTRTIYLQLHRIHTRG